MAKRRRAAALRKRRTAAESRKTRFCATKGEGKRSRQECRESGAGRNISRSLTTVRAIVHFALRKQRGRDRVRDDMLLVERPTTTVPEGQMRPHNAPSFHLTRRPVATSAPETMARITHWRVHGAARAATKMAMVKNTKTEIAVVPKRASSLPRIVLVEDKALMRGSLCARWSGAGRGRRRRGGGRRE